MLFPSTACLVQDKIGATRAWGFDLSAACSAFTYALTVGQPDGRGPRRQPRAGDRRRRDVEHHRLHRSRHLRAVRRRRRRRGPRRVGRSAFGILDFEHQVDGSGGQALCMPAGGSRQPASHETVDQRLHYVKQEGQAVFKFAVRNTGEICERLLQRNRVTASDLDLFVSHQANRRIIMSAAERIGMPRRQGHHQHRSVRQHDGRHHSAGAQRRGRRAAG